MPIKGFRLISIVPHGVGGPEAGAICLIYAKLLHEFGQDFYNITVNQIGEGTDPDEIILKEPGNKIHINIRYPAPEDFETRSGGEKNRYRLDVVHAALNRIADHDGMYDKLKLEEIRSKILEHDFSFQFHLKKFVCPKRKDLIASIVVEPMMDMFLYFVVVESNGKKIHKILIYQGQTDLYGFRMFFQNGKWNSENGLILSGKENVVQTHIFIWENRAEFVNLTQYEKPPIFEMMKVGISEEEKEKAHQDWLDSLPPYVAAIITQQLN
ncbi:MAG: hypothetical protein ACXVMS_17155 [Flavisolibacter sp.]